jgi:DNA-binding MarR family transcriptional regulator
MTTEATPDTRAGRLHANEGDALDLIETEMAVLARALERLHRRSEIYRDLDRASYLIARTMEITGPVSINGLAAALGLDATTVTRQVATMEATRLILRRADRNDGRVTLISLSENGRRKMRAVQLARKERVATLLGDWTENDRHELGRLLARFNDELSRDVTLRNFR